MPETEEKISVKVGNRERVLKFTTNSLCLLEDDLGMATLDIVDMFRSKSLGFKILRSMVWAACLSNEPSFTKDQAGEIIDAVGFTECVAKVSKAFMVGFPGGSETKTVSKKDKK